MSDTATASVHRLVYASRSLIDPERRDEELKSIFAVARAHNGSVAVTGALYISTDRFVQILEGERDVVQSLYQSIRKDPRHDQVELAHQGPVDYRVFGAWSMAEVSDTGHSDIHYQMDESGAAPETVLADPSPNASILLTVMQSYLAQARFRSIVDQES